MLIDYKALEFWLHDKLKPLCVADPVPLSQYVIALIKKDKPENELREICIDQLEVFLQENTSSFVEDLFTTLNARSYVTEEASDPIPKKEDLTVRTVHSRSETSKDKKRSVTSESFHSDSTTSKAPSKSATSGKNKVARSRSRSPLTAARSLADPRSTSRGRRGRDSPERESYKSRSEEVSESRVVSSRNRREDSPEGNDRSDNYSRRSRLREPEGQRHRFARERFRSPDRDRYGSRVASSNRTDGAGRDASSRKRRCRNFEERGVCASGAHCPFDHGPHALVLPSSKAAAAAITQLSTGQSVPSSISTVDGTANTSAAATKDSERPAAVTVASIPVVRSAGVSETQFTNSSGSASLTSVTAPVLPVYRPTPIHQPIVNAVTQPEPIAFDPSLLTIPPPVLTSFTWPTLNLHNPFATRPVPANEFYRGPVRHNVVQIPMRETSTNNITVTESADSSTSAALVPPAYEPDRPQISMISARSSTSPPASDTTWTFSTAAATPSDPPQVYTPSPISERLGPEVNKASHKATSASGVKSTSDRATDFPSVLYVTRLPWKLNDADKLQDHFSKFGTVLKIVTRFNGLSDAAMVEFSCPAEAELTYRSPEPIFSNRFIRLSLQPPTLQRLGGRPVRYEFRAKTLQNRLSVKNRLGSRSFVPWNSSYSNTTDFQTTPIKASMHTSRGRSRFRLERDRDTSLHESPQASGDDEDDVDTGRRPKSSERDDAGDAGEDVTGDEVNGDGSAVFGVELARARLEATRSGGSKAMSLINSTMRNQETAAYMWEKQKQAALKQRQEQLNFLDKAREAKKSAVEAQRQLVIRLRNQLKKVMAQLEGRDRDDTDLPASVPSSTGVNGTNLTTAERRRLLDNAKRIQAELEQAMALERTLISKRVRLSSESDPTSVGSTAVSAAALQALPESMATERRKQIAEVKVELTKIEAEMNMLKAKGEPFLEQRRRILELKRQLVSLETVRPSDLYGSPGGSTDPYGMNYSSRTKLDKRPRTLFVSGLTHSDVDDFQRALAVNYLHTQQVLRHSEPLTNQPILEITFRTRDFAEAAMRLLQNFSGRLLEMSFAAPPLSESPSAALSTPTGDKTLAVSCSSEPKVTSTLADVSYPSVLSHKVEMLYPGSPHSSPTSTTFAMSELPACDN